MLNEFSLSASKLNESSPSETIRITKNSDFYYLFIHYQRFER